MVDGEDRNLGWASAIQPATANFPVFPIHHPPSTIHRKFKEYQKAQAVSDAARLLPKFTTLQAEAVDLKGHIAGTRRALAEYKNELDASRLALGDDPDYASHEETVARGLNKYLDD